MRDIMQQALVKAEHWAEINGLKFSPEKTASLLFTKRYKYKLLKPLKIYGEEIGNVDTTKYLGVILD